jgi:hypothetical protein
MNHTDIFSKFILYTIYNMIQEFVNNNDKKDSHL